MRCGIFANAKGEILIIHDQEIDKSVQWVEYHKKNRQIFVVYENGRSQDLGLKIDKKMQRNLSNGMQVKLFHIQDKQITSIQEAAFIIQDC